MKSLMTLAFIMMSCTVAASGEMPAKATQCNACHGANGAAPIMDNYPKLNGQNKGYLISALKDYRDGKRNGALSAAMVGQAAQLTDEDIEALADYYSSQP